MKTFYRLFYTFVATSLFIFVYLINNRINVINCFFSFVPKSLGLIISSCCYFLIILFLTWVCIKIQKLNLNTDELKNIKELEYADSSFLPSYLGFFFVALSLPKPCCIEHIIISFIIYSLIFVFTFFSRAAYYNPMFLLFGYKFYYAKNSENVKILLITKRSLRKNSDCYFEKLHRINDYTFLDINKDEKK